MNCGGYPPEWANLLDMSAEWGCPPWVIEEGPAIWYERWKFYSQQREAKMNAQMNAQMRSANGR